MKKPPPPPTNDRRPFSPPQEVNDKPAARAEYLRVVHALKDKLNELDLSLLVDYAITHAEIIELRRDVELEGYKLEGPKGGQYINPTVNVLISRQSHMAALRRDLYFTPKSRIEKQPKSAGKARSIKDRLQQEIEADES